MGVSHRRGDRIRTYGLLYLLQLGGAGAFQVLCQAELHLYCPFYARAGDRRLAPLASTVAIAARIGASEQAPHTVGASAVACFAHLASSARLFLSLLVWGFTHVKLLLE